MSFKALVTRENGKNNLSHSIEEREIKDLPDNDVLVKVHYSALNYKDALSAKGHKGISRNYPHSPGVDAAGIVEEDKSGTFSKGDKVVVTGHDLGMNTSGGFSEYIRVPSEWLVSLPNKLNLKEAMIYGTAGMTAAICVNELIKHDINPDSGKVLVTGSTGGVGSMGVAILGKLGYKVIASTGKKEKHDYLKHIGASEIIERSDVYDETGKPLLSRRWIGAIDTVGGNTLSTVFRSTDHHGVVCVLGLVESHELHTNLFPFLQRGVSLLGIDSAERGIEIKRKLWKHLASDWKPDMLDEMATEVSLLDIEPEIDKILAGKQVGKILINCQVSS